VRIESKENLVLPTQISEANILNTDQSDDHKKIIFESSNRKNKGKGAFT